MMRSFFLVPWRLSRAFTPRAFVQSKRSYIAPLTKKGSISLYSRILTVGLGALPCVIAKSLLRLRHHRGRIAKRRALAYRLPFSERRLDASSNATRRRLQSRRTLPIEPAR